ncbi:phosphodiester glycosidase family protein [Pedobacter alpinus]|uniref:Phosphodiester glycosidase family protein n=1 Tax=Pedobacter alpinus TaxID=1590643 RepID=A0ABW5TQU9_9SPHI
MKQITILILCLSVFTLSAKPQNDSLTINNFKNWQTKRITKGVKSKTIHFNDCNFFKAKQHISIIEVSPKSNSKFDLAYQPSELLILDTIAKRKQALAAINGTFFDIKNGGSVDYIESNDTVINQSRLGKNNVRAEHQKGAILFNNYKLSIAQWDKTENWEQKFEATDVMVTGPVLIINQENVVIANDAFNLARAPRSAIGIKEDGTVLMVAIDGRMIEAEGVTIIELQQIMKWLGCSNAINLDGGGSTTLYVKHKKNGQIINHPSDNKIFDNAGQRKVANAILLIK